MLQAVKWKCLHSFVYSGKTTLARPLTALLKVNLPIWLASLSHLFWFIVQELLFIVYFCCRYCSFIISYCHVFIFTYLIREFTFRAEISDWRWSNYWWQWRLSLLLKCCWYSFVSLLLKIRLHQQIQHMLIGKIAFRCSTAFSQECKSWLFCI